MFNRWKNKFVGFLANIKNNFVLDIIYNVGKHGREVVVSRGFSIYHGSHNVIIGHNVCLVDCLINAGDKNGKVTIGNYVFVGHRVMILARGHNYSLSNLSRIKTIVEKPISIEDGVWIGSGSIILGGVKIGRNSVIGAGSVVTRNVPPNTIYAGIPAKLIRKINK